MRSPAARLEHCTIAFAPRSRTDPKSVPPGPRGPGYEGAHQIVECNSTPSTLSLGVEPRPPGGRSQCCKQDWHVGDVAPRLAFRPPIHASNEACRGVQQTKSQSRSDMSYGQRRRAGCGARFRRASCVPPTCPSLGEASRLPSGLNADGKNGRKKLKKRKRGESLTFAFLEFLAASTLRPRHLKLLHRAVLRILHGDFTNLPPLLGTSDFGEIADNQPAQ